MTADRPEISHVDYSGLPKIPKATREMVFFRVKATHIDYLDPLRSAKVIRNPMIEHIHLLQQMVEIANRKEAFDEAQKWSNLIDHC